VVVSPEFVRVCAVDDVQKGVPLAFSVSDASDPERVLVRVDGELHALTGVCPHQGADLSEGIVENGILWCPVHSSGFDCRTGAVTHPPAPGPLRTYHVRIEGGDVHVSVRPGG
jgi:nitrite reductase/ring-hydroxylating ferredoxin subunit